jgi:hypothetical protein
MAKALTLLQRRRDHIELLIEARIELEQVPSVLSSVLSGEAFKYIVVF